MENVFKFIESIGALPDDSPGLKLQKRFLVYLGSAMSLGGILWGSLSVYFGLTLPAVIPYGYVVLTVLNLSVFAVFKNFALARFFQVLISLALPFMFQFALGSFASTGAIMLWALISLVGAFTFESLKNTIYWLGLYIALTIAMGICDSQSLAQMSVAKEVSTLFFVLNITVISTIVAGLSYYLLKSRGRLLEELAEAKRETDAVMASVDEGLFLLTLAGDDYIVGAEQSAATSRLFGGNKLPATEFSRALETFLSPHKTQELQNFLKLLRSGKLKSSMIMTLNPLDQVPISMGALTDVKFLRFGFSQVQSGKNDQYLVRISDITEEKKLREQLEETERKNANHTQMILSVLHVGPSMLRDFLSGTESELKIIMDILQSDHTPEQVAARLEELYRSAHSIKGNASLLDLGIIVSSTHDLEEKIQALREKPELRWDDFLPVATEVANLQETLAGLHGLLGRIESFREEDNAVMRSAVSGIPRVVSDMVGRLAQQVGKRVQIETSGFDQVEIPYRHAYFLRDVVVQLARNAVAHGIEHPEKRKESGKAEHGNIAIGLAKKGGMVELRVYDDGASFDLEAIRRSAAGRRNVPDQVARDWTAKELVKFIFEPGFSTAEDVTTTAGRGMGMDIIRQRVRQMGGDLRINYAPGSFTEFTITMPVEVAPA
ncbi:MAG: ATP-binding protein [Spirochaetota bacterium]